MPRNGLLGGAVNIVIGFGLPLITTGIGFGAAYAKYGENGCQLDSTVILRCITMVYCSCYCDLNSKQAWGYLLPLAFWAFGVGITAEAAAGEKYKQLHDTEHVQFIQGK